MELMGSAATKGTPRHAGQQCLHELYVYTAESQRRAHAEKPARALLSRTRAHARPIGRTLKPQKTHYPAHSLTSHASPSAPKQQCHSANRVLLLGPGLARFLLRLRSDPPSLGSGVFLGLEPVVGVQGRLQGRVQLGALVLRSARGARRAGGEATEMGRGGSTVRGWTGGGQERWRGSGRDTGRREDRMPGDRLTRKM